MAAGETALLVKAAAVKDAHDAQLAKNQAAAATPTPTPRTVSAFPSPATKSKIQNVIGAKLSNLVALEGKKLGPFKSDSLASKKYIAVYYSASWCGPCRNFTPDLVKWYKRNASKSELFELIFVSADRSESQMQGYMIEDKMPWPHWNLARSRWAIRLWEREGLESRAWSSSMPAGIWSPSLT